MFLLIILTFQVYLTNYPQFYIHLTLPIILTFQAYPAFLNLLLIKPFLPSFLPFQHIFSHVLNPFTLTNYPQLYIHIILHIILTFQAYPAFLNLLLVKPKLFLPIIRTFQAYLQLCPKHLLPLPIILKFTSILPYPSSSASEHIPYS